MTARMRTALIALGTMTFVNGCASTPPLLRPTPPIPVEWEDQAARGGLAILSVAPWDEYVATLQPEFKLTPEDALAQAIPTTIRQQGELLDALNASLKLALPTTTTTSKSSTDSGRSSGTQKSLQNAETSQTSNTETTGAEPKSTQATTQNTTSTDAANGSTSMTTQSSTVTTRQPGDVSKVTAPSVPDLPPSVKPTKSPLDGDIDRDPMTKFAAATALYQEVQLINHYVKDAALRKGMQAYVVRLQVSVLPQLRGQAYDAYAMLSFLYGKKASAPVLNPYAARTRGADGNPVQKTVPTVIPLLVTDSLEQSAAATSTSRLRGFGLALLAMAGGVGVSGDVARRVQTLQAVLGEESNSLLTVTKVLNNVLRVRFGAINQIGGLAMEARNHTVTILVLAPTEFDEQVDVLSKLELVRATDGVAVPERPFSVIRTEVYATACRYVPNCTTQLTAAQQTNADQLAYAVQAADPSQFETAMQALSIDAAGTHRLWVDLSSVQSKSPYTAASFELPRRADPISSDQEQVVTVIDDGGGTVANLRNVMNIGTGELTSVLAVTKDSLQQTFPAVSTTISGSSVKLAFPSLQKLKLCAAVMDCTVELQVYWTPAVSRWSPAAVQPTEMHFKQTRLLLVPEPQEPPAAPFFSVSSGSRHIIRTGAGAGSLRLLFVPNDKHQDEPMFFTIDGADIVEVHTPGVKLGTKGWQVTPTTKGAAMTVELWLGNLSEDVEVRIIANNGKASKDPLVFRVRTATNTAAK